jgi:hypothetical protein
MRPDREDHRVKTMEGVMFWVIALVCAAVLCLGAYLYDRRNRRRGKAPGTGEPTYPDDDLGRRSPWQDFGGGGGS